MREVAKNRCCIPSAVVVKSRVASKNEPRRHNEHYAKLVVSVVSSWFLLIGSKKKKFCDVDTIRLRKTWALLHAVIRGNPIRQATRRTPRCKRAEVLQRNHVFFASCKSAKVVAFVLFLRALRASVVIHFRAPNTREFRIRHERTILERLPKSRRLTPCRWQ